MSGRRDRRAIERAVDRLERNIGDQGKGPVPSTEPTVSLSPYSRTHWPDRTPSDHLSADLLATIDAATKSDRTPGDIDIDPDIGADGSVKDLES